MPGRWNIFKFSYQVAQVSWNNSVIWVKFPRQKTNTSSDFTYGATVFCIFSGRRSFECVMWWMWYYHIMNIIVCDSYFRDHSLSNFKQQALARFPYIRCSFSSVLSIVLLSSRNFPQFLRQNSQNCMHKHQNCCEFISIILRACWCLYCHLHSVTTFCIHHVLPLTAVCWLSVLSSAL